MAAGRTNYYIVVIIIMIDIILYKTNKKRSNIRHVFNFVGCYRQGVIRGNVQSHVTSHMTFP